MSQIDEHLKWCLKDPRRLIKTKPDIDLAQKHVKKSEYNYQIVQTLEKLNIYDWAFNIGFYSIYHCFLALLAKYGYESRNQACTITVLLTLIDEKSWSWIKIWLLSLILLMLRRISPTPQLGRAERYQLMVLRQVWIYSN